MNGSQKNASRNTRYQLSHLRMWIDTTYQMVWKQLNQIRSQKSSYDSYTHWTLVDCISVLCGTSTTWLKYTCAQWNPLEIILKMCSYVYVGPDNLKCNVCQNESQATRLRKLSANLWGTNLCWRQKSHHSAFLNAIFTVIAISTESFIDYDKYME